MSRRRGEDPLALNLHPLAGMMIRWAGRLGVVVGILLASEAGAQNLCACAALAGAGTIEDLTRVARCEQRAVRVSARRCEQGPRTTRNVGLAGNLYPGTFFFGPFDPSSAQRMFDTSDFSATVAIVDSTGTRRWLTIFFTHVAIDAWTVYVADVHADGAAVVLNPSGGTLAFDGDGRLRRARGLTAVIGRQRVTLDARALTQRMAPSGLSCVVQDGCS